MNDSFGPVRKALASAQMQSLCRHMLDMLAFKGLLYWDCGADDVPNCCKDIGNARSGNAPSSLAVGGDCAWTFQCSSLFWMCISLSLQP